VRYQWRLNGLNIPATTNSCFTLTNVQVVNGGSYTVVVANDAGAITSDPAVLIVEVAALQAADYFTNRVELLAPFRTVSGTNAAATFETGEPLHAGKPGGKSVWYKWHAPANGIATFDTEGSAFDTLLAIYTGTNVTNLTATASDEDSGGFLTSLVKFNVTSGSEYQIAIDGFGGVGGRFVLHWDFEPSAEIVPAITNQPASVAARLGGSGSFSVTAVASQPGITYQWFFNGVLIDGATNTSITLTDVQYSDVGVYSVRVRHTNNPARITESAPAWLEIGPFPARSLTINSKTCSMPCLVHRPRLCRPDQEHGAAGGSSNSTWAISIGNRSLTAVRELRRRSPIIAMWWAMAPPGVLAFGPSAKALCRGYFRQRHRYPHDRLSL
jgi:hypothetical protein